MPVAILGVIDLLDGRAVHARGGDRAGYRPVTTVAGVPIAPGDALAVATEYRERFGVEEIYVADLDAIMGKHPQHALTTRLAATMPVWLDAGVTSPAGARGARSAGAHRVIVGLETLASFEALDAICADIGGSRIAFSVDLRDGVPVAADAVRAVARAPEAIAARAAAAGAGAILVLDLARVGAGLGVDLSLIERIRTAAPSVMLLAGGGVRDDGDLAALDRAGCDGALVASALLSGALTGRGGHRRFD